MLAIADMQETVRSTIAAFAYFSGETVLADDGKQFDAVNAALETKGHCIVVLPILRTVLLSQATGAAIRRAIIGVRVGVNPETATKDIYALCHNVETAVLTYTLTNRADRFELGESPWELVTNDPGVRSYQVTFQKPYVA